MKLFTFLFHLLSFLPIKPVEKGHHHILVADIKQPIPKSVVETIKPIHTLIYFHTHPIPKRDDCVDVYLPKLLQENKCEVDSFQTSKYHYEHFLQHKFSRHITYSDYCKVEKQVSLIIQEYLKDGQHNYGIILDDIFLDTEGIRKYWTMEKNYILIRTSLDDKLNIPNYVIVEKAKDYNFL